MEESILRPVGDGRVTRRGHAMQSVYWNKQPAELLSATAGGKSEREKVRERSRRRERGGREVGESGEKEDNSGHFAYKSRCHNKRMREKESLHHHGLEALQWFWSRNLQSYKKKIKRGKKEKSKTQKAKLKSKGEKNTTGIQKMNWKGRWGNQWKKCPNPISRVFVFISCLIYFFPLKKNSKEKEMCFQWNQNKIKVVSIKEGG